VIVFLLWLWITNLAPAFSAQKVDCRGSNADANFRAGLAAEREFAAAPHGTIGRDQEERGQGPKRIV